MSAIRSWLMFHAWLRNQTKRNCEVLGSYKKKRSECWGEQSLGPPASNEELEEITQTPPFRELMAPFGIDVT